MSGCCRPGSEVVEDAGNEILLIDIEEVSRRVNIGERTLWRYISERKFPPPDVSIGKKVRRWKPGTIRLWIDKPSESRGGYV
jgi:predicted DNA-binding transcriptional regulator AlpA